jgi:hypothetical protein
MSPIHIPLLFLGLLMPGQPGWAQEADDRPTLIILDLQARNTNKDTAALVTEVLGTSFERTGIFQVRTEADVRRAIDLEAEKESLGCDTDSCLAEIAGAMGAAYVAHGTVGALDKTTLVTVSLYHHAKAKSLGRRRLQVEDKGTLPQKMDEMVKDLVEGLELPTNSAASSAGDVEVEEKVESGGATSSPLFWTGAVLFGVGAVTGVGAGIYAAMLHGQLADPNGPPERDELRGTGQIVTGVAIGGAVLAVVGGGLMAIPLMSE